MYPLIARYASASSSIDRLQSANEPLDHPPTVRRSYLSRASGRCYSKRTLPGDVMRRSSGSVTAITPKATARPMPISA